MFAATYDTTSNGVVDNSEKLENQSGTYYLSRTNHTGTQAASTITEDSTHRFVTDAEKTTWNASASVADKSFETIPYAATVSLSYNSSRPNKKNRNPYRKHSNN
jgi:hypothetical protein